MIKKRSDVELILSSITDGIVVVDKLGVALYANQSAERIFERDALLGHYLAIPASDAATHQDINLIRPSGIGYAELRSSPITWEGQPAFVIGVRDITEKKRAEITLTLNRKLIQSIIDGSSALIYALDIDGNFTLANKPLTQLLDIEIAKILGHDRSVCMPANVALEHRKNDLAVIKSGLAIEFEETIPAADGNHVYLSHKFPLRDEANEIIGMAGISTDITERKREEEDVRIAAIAFESQEGIILTDANAIILRVNRAFTTLTGYSVAEVIGQTPHFLTAGRHNKSFYKSLWSDLRKNSYWQGEILNRRKNGELYTEWLTLTAVIAPDGSTSHYVGAFSDITYQEDAKAEIHQLAFYDSLTNLANRRLLEDRLSQALVAARRSGVYGAVLFLDMDNFKAINDTCGHTTGNLLLIEVARRLHDLLRSGDTVARLGGDEFVVLFENLSKKVDEAARQLKSLSHKILDVLAQPYHIHSYEFFCSASIGVDLFCQRGETAEELLKHTDMAMYQAKDAGRNRVCFFDQTMQAMVTARAELERDLRQALELGQFSLYYQLQVYRDHKYIGAEVLIRWHHPERGLVSPIEFIPLSEETGLILPIGQWVMDTACEQLKLWENQPHTQELQLAVNVSASQFGQANFVSLVEQTIKRHAINPALLKLELTESLVLSNVEDAIAKMNALNNIGVRFSLDDFGTGFSSLAYLTQLPLNQLKIDQSFVRNIGVKPADAIIVQTIIGMARNLGIEVIAEGVETEAQRAFLEQHGCPTYQGYLFSKPVPIEPFEALLKPM
jgi:diguanylate cyclase (GGDEF)-like protein/PAS domain S-box-containing protein